LQMIAGVLASEYPADNRLLTRAIATAELDHLVGNMRPAMRILFAAVGTVLLIACVNVAGLLLARASHRRAEAGIMAALGASRWAIVRQLVLESVCLSMAGGAVGIFLAVWMVEVLRRVLPATLPRFESVSVDSTVLMFAAAISIGTGILFGLFPALRISVVEPLVALRGGTRSVTARSRIQNVLVVAETAMGLVLLAGSGLLVRSFLHVLAVNPGFDAQNVLAVDLSVSESRYPDERRLQLYRELVSRVTAIPGVQSAAAGWPLPLSSLDVNIEFEIEGRPLASGTEMNEHMGVTTPGFFQTMRIPLMAGRDFRPSDDANAPGVIIVNQAFAKKYFPGESVLGKRIRAGISDGHFKGAFREVVGLVGNVKRTSLTAEMDPQYYLPWPQAVITWPTIVVRSAGDPAILTPAIRSAVGDVDRTIPAYRVARMKNSVLSAAAEPRFQTLLVGSFAAMALLLSAVGLCAVLSYTVTQRAGEIGIRMALGAARRDVLALILRNGLAISTAGLIIGLIVSAVLTRQLSGILYGVSPLDAMTFGVVSAVLLFVSIAASLPPALRAANVDPMRVLREQ
jgi:predicted permease